jgi:hypothetical protein
MSSSVRSLAARIRALAEAEIPFDEAERLLRVTVTQPDTATRAHEERRETAELLGLDSTHILSREARLRRWLGVDLAHPPEGE